MPERKERKTRVPSSRAHRLWHIGNAATRLAAGGAKELAQRVVGRSEMGQALLEHSALLTPANARALADRLSRLRGAAMKLGQMLSLEGDSMLPKEFADALAVLRDNADTMPHEQVSQVMRAEFGKEWQKLFLEFEFEPIASASIGQVHRAKNAAGAPLALKVQYPGVAKSIDSDVDNLSSLLRLSRLVPSGIDVEDLIAEVKLQLKEEVDYQRELSQLKAYQSHLADWQHIRTPQGHDALTTQSVLTMDYISAQTLDEWQKSAPQDERNRIARQLVELTLAEFLRFGLVQTDPNLSNFCVDEEGQLVLFDFGATRQLTRAQQTLYRGVLEALLSRDAQTMLRALLDAGFITDAMPRDAQQLTVQMGLDLAEICATAAAYDFHRSDLPKRLKQTARELFKYRKDLPPPPAQLVFFQRKLTGMFLICRTLRAQVACRPLMEAALVH